MNLSKRHNVVMYLILFVLCVIGTHGKPSFSFNLPIGSFGPNGKKEPDQLKSYSGKRINQDSLRMVYFNDQTVAVVELGPNKLLLNCEFIEILQQNQLFDVLGELKPIARPVGINFNEMLTLMDQCKILEEREARKNKDRTNTNTTSAIQARGLKNPFTLLSGIIPGTKWCGTGDIAKDYNDLGEERMVDTCCRTHDLCPVKIRAYSKRYSLINNSLYTKSHCKCDDDLFNCLKKLKNSNTANIMGNIYFNLVQVPCLEDSINGTKQFRKPRNNF